MIKIIGPSEEELAFEASNNYGIEPETPARSVGVSSEIDIFDINDVNKTLVQEDRSFRQQEVRYIIDDS